MKSTTPVQERQSDHPFQPRNWSLRTKISVVLLLPVLVALVLAGARVQTELSEAGKLSSVRDRLPIMKDTAELADEVNKEMIAVASTDGSAVQSARAAVDAKTADVQREANFASLAPDTERRLNIAIGQLGGLRAANTDPAREPVRARDPVAITAGYREIALQLSELLPSLLADAGSTELDGAASTARSLLELRTDLAVTEALLRAATTRSDDRRLLIAAWRAAAGEAAISEQVRRDSTGIDANRFAAAVSGIEDRQAALQRALISGSTGQRGGLLTAIATESNQLGPMLGGLVDRLAVRVSAQTNQTRADALRDTALVLAALLGALAIALLTARSLVWPIRRLRTAALHAARSQLPDTIRQVRAGTHVDWHAVEPVPVRGGDEIGQLARAFDDMHQQAVRLAGEQAELRMQVSEMFMTLSRRSQSLIEHQLDVIEGLESDEQDPDRLNELFRLDHLATRLRRNGENLQVLAGGTPSRQDTGPVPMTELLRGATSEVKDYQRISIVHAPSGSVRPHAAADIVHILAELLDNATRFSPPEENVVLTADRGTEGGLLVEVVDSGLGMTNEDLHTANERLTLGATVDPETTRRMGLFVVGRLAAAHGVVVRLRPTMSGAVRKGITASVHVPAELIIADGAPAELPPAAAAPMPSRSQEPAEPLARLNGSALSMPRHAQRVEQTEPMAPVQTPIFDEVLSRWFIEMPGESSDQQPPAWTTPVDQTRRAAEEAMSQPPAAVTSAGLPMRNPGSQLAPGAAAPRNGEETVRQNDFRDPHAVRDNLARHYDGLRAARRRAENDGPLQERTVDAP